MMELNYQASPRKRRQPAGFATITLRIVTACFIASIVTLPLKNALWIGELPLLTLFQQPKIMLANWLRYDVVMAAIKVSGLSRGSFSPDSLMARPYALALAYLIILGLVFLVVWISGRWKQPSRPWICITLLAAVTDYAATLWFAGGPGLSFY